MSMPSSLFPPSSERGGKSNRMQAYQVSMNNLDEMFFEDATEKILSCLLRTCTSVKLIISKKRRLDP